MFENNFCCEFPTTVVVGCRGIIRVPISARHARPSSLCPSFADKLSLCQKERSLRVCFMHALKACERLFQFSDPASVTGLGAPLRKTNARPR